MRALHRLFVLRVVLFRVFRLVGSFLDALEQFHHFASFLT